MTALAPTLQAFFTDYLVGQRDASRHTISAYRDTFRLLLGYIHERTGTTPNDLDFSVVNAELIAGFLTMLEDRRGNSARTRNARLAAIHSLFHYAALRHPEHADLIARVLAIARKNTDSTLMTYLNENEVHALLAAPNRATWTGRRDHLMILMMITTGLRVSEITSLTRADTQPDAPGAHIACHGKGRKDRITPLETGTANELHTWFRENPGPPTAPIFTANGTNRPMTTDAVAQRIKHHSLGAAATCPSLATRKITPHILRHTTAMRMLAAGIDITTIALWLGHESPASTRPYLHADLQIKQRALDRTAGPHTTPGRFTPSDDVLAFLQTL
ncbi:tyrosine-type recombinase/integrase [Specibacter cremeus]|uniref:tyrosine-type recombinase/integrase n=1 Tax=Specibacter cremeus TaxID=1629051 RepID=UPI000F78A085|nr:tyrosine-type recombinase/integrase [Specibacter cremeus]